MVETSDHHPTICYSRYSHMFHGMSDCWRVNPMVNMVQIGLGGATSMQDRNVGHAQSREAFESPIAVDFRWFQVPSFQHLMSWSTPLPNMQRRSLGLRIREVWSPGIRPSAAGKPLCAKDWNICDFPSDRRWRHHGVAWCGGYDVHWCSHCFVPTSQNSQRKSEKVRSRQLMSCFWFCRLL